MVLAPNGRMADPGGRMVLSVGLRLLGYWDYGFESRWGHGRLSLERLLCVVRSRPLRRADHSYRGVLPNVVCLSVIVKPR